VFEIKDKEARSVKLRDGFAHMADEFLITKKDVDELKSHYEALKAKMNEKKNETQPPILAEKEDLIKQLKEKQRALLENEQLKYNNLENTLKETEQKYFDYIEAKKKEYEKEIGDLESHYHDITIKKVSVIEEQKDNQEKARERYRKDISEMIKEHNNKIRGTE
jgi:anion-transporting  ArsA/GET3 family ATPase